MKKRYNPLVLKSLSFFVNYPYRKVHLREFSRILKISPNTANRFLDLFLKEGFLTEKRVANLRYFQANLDSLTFREIKKTFLLKKIEDSRILKDLEKVSSSVVIFGSSAKGTNDEKSDIDLVIISSKKEEVKKILNKYQKRFSVDLSYHLFTKLEWKKQKEENRAFYEDVLNNNLSLIGEGLI